MKKNFAILAIVAVAVILAAPVWAQTIYGETEGWVNATLLHNASINLYDGCNGGDCRHSEGVRVSSDLSGTANSGAKAYEQRTLGTPAGDPGSYPSGGFQGKNQISYNPSPGVSINMTGEIWGITSSIAETPH